jgi:hypothetical protein
VRAWIQDLYRIDAQATTTEQRARLRATESAAVLEKMKSWMHEQRVLATTSLGSAIRYTLESWERLTVFVRDPLVWLDNNRTAWDQGAAGHRPSKPLRLQVSPWDRRCRDPVQPGRVRQGRWR